MPTPKPFVSIVVPALNEALTIGEFVEWCKLGLKKAGVKGEVLIVDSSTDRTAEIAEAHGARVVKVPKRGLGQAYIDALPHIRGTYVIMGDCDLTYDFRELKAFIQKLDQGFEFVMGTRMHGTIEPGAMPPLHRYFGTPLTTWIMNFMYGSHFSDIHCGMRAMTREALQRIDLESSSWEYASEMVLKATKLKLKTTEIPIQFYRDREGRVSQHKRLGWFSPWQAGWINLKIMFLWLPDFFLKRPGLLSLAIGTALVLLLLRGPVKLGPVSLSLHAMLLGITLMVVGYSAIQMGILAEMLNDLTGDPGRDQSRWFSYNRGTLLGLLLIGLGLALLGVFLYHYIRDVMVLKAISTMAIVGLVSVILGFQTFTFTLVYQLAVKRREKRGRSASRPKPSPTPEGKA